MQSLRLQTVDAFLIESEHHARTAHNYGPPNQIGLPCHQADCRFSRRRFFFHIPTAVKLVACVEEFRVVAPADQLFQFRGAQPLLRQVAKVKKEPAPLHISARVAAGCAIRLLQEFYALSSSLRPSRNLALSSGHHSVLLSIVARPNPLPKPNGRSRPPSSARAPDPENAATQPHPGCGSRDGTIE